MYRRIQKIINRDTKKAKEEWLNNQRKEILVCDNMNVEM